MASPTTIRTDLPLSGLQWHQLAGEVTEEVIERCWRCRGPDDELADPGQNVLLDRPLGRCPARGDERGGVAAGPALAYGGSQVSGNTTTGCDRKADPEVVGLNLAARSRGGTLDGFPRCPSLLGVSKLPSHPSASRPTRLSAPGALPPSQISSGLAGSGPMCAPSTVKNSPRKDTCSCVSSSLISRSDSSNTAARRPAGTSNSPRSPARAGCRPKTGSTRPGASPASDARCLATSTGWRPGSTATPVPTFSREVRDSAYAMPANGSTREPNTISDSHSESTPSASTRSTASPNTAGTAAGPSETPILTFMPPSDHEQTRARARHQDHGQRSALPPAVE